MCRQATAIAFAAVLIGTTPLGATAAASWPATSHLVRPSEEERESPSGAAPIFELTAGAKVGGGGEVWTRPSRRTISYQDQATGGSAVFDIPIFDDTRAGYNYSVGIYAEMRFWRYLGLEVALFMTRHTLFEETDWSYTEMSAGGAREIFRTRTEQHLVFTSFHIPLIVKGILPVANDRVRLSLGIGPEFAIGSYASASFRHKGGYALPLRGDRKDFEDMGARTRNDIYLAVLLGADIKAGYLRVPIDLKFAYNFSQPSDYYDRIEYNRLPGGGAQDGHPNHGIFNARNSMYFQMTVGVAFDFL